MEQPVKIESFRAGISIRNPSGYTYFVPDKVNRQWIWADATLSTLLERASHQMGRLDSFSQLVPNVDLFIQLYVTKEAVISSRIEGTQTNFDEALLSEEDISPERRQDWAEVKNYTTALNKAVKELQSLPLSSRLFRTTHWELMQGVRGENKMPGEYRRSQNWIGGASLVDAIFIPPHHTYLDELMGDLENFLHNTEIQVPTLIRAGIAHYQFETIHPFLDGNGRIGRLLITLYLISEKVLDKPLLYLSVFFERNKALYYDNLTRVRTENDLLHWLRYFLVGIEETARQAAQTLSDILELKNRLEQKIRGTWGRRTRSGLELLNHLFYNPVVRIKNVAAVCEISQKAAGDLVSTFIEEGILYEFTGYSRNRVFTFRDYLTLFR